MHKCISIHDELRAKMRGEGEEAHYREDKKLKAWEKC